MVNEKKAEGCSPFEYQRPLENLTLTNVGLRYKKCAVERIWLEVTDNIDLSPPPQHRTQTTAPCKRSVVRPKRLGNESFAIDESKKVVVDH